MRAWWIALMLSTGCGVEFNARGAAGGAATEGGGVATGGSAEGGVGGTGGSAEGGAGGAPLPVGGGGQGGIAALDCSSADLMLCLPFDGDALDASPAAQIVDLVGAPPVYVAGKNGQAASFDGVSTELYIANGPSMITSLITMEMWIRADDLPAVRYGLVDGSGSYSMYLFADGTIWCAHTENGMYAGVIVPGQWTHVACVNDGSAWTFFQDGTLVDQATGTPLVLPGDDIGIANNQPDGDQQFSGEVDSLRIFTTPRSPLEICEAAGGC